MMDTRRLLSAVLVAAAAWLAPAASCWHGAFWMVDCADVAPPRSLGSYNYHPPFPEPTHTVMPLPARISSTRR